jgi:hypothetical protein
MELREDEEGDPQGDGDDAAGFYIAYVGKRPHFTARGLRSGQRVTARAGFAPRGVLADAVLGLCCSCETVLASPPQPPPPAVVATLPSQAGANAGMRVQWDAAACQGTMDGETCGNVDRRGGGDEARGAAEGFDVFLQQPKSARFERVAHVAAVADATWEDDGGASIGALIPGPLQPNSRFAVRTQAWNAAGRSPVSSSVYFTTPPSVPLEPSAAPIAAAGEQSAVAAADDGGSEHADSAGGDGGSGHAGSSWLRLQWFVAVATGEGSGWVEPRELHFALQREGTPSDAFVELTPLNRALVVEQVSRADGKAWLRFRYRARRLAPQTAYRFRFALCNSAGRGCWSDWSAALLTTAPNAEAPLPPPHLRCVPDAATHTSLAFQWGAADGRGNSISSYQLELAEVGNDDGALFRVAYEGLKTSCTVGGLLPATRYTVRVRACTGAGGQGAASLLAIRAEDDAVCTLPAPSVQQQEVQRARAADEERARAASARARGRAVDRGKAAAAASAKLEDIRSQWASRRFMETARRYWVAIALGWLAIAAAVVCRRHAAQSAEPDWHGL